MYVKEMKENANKRNTIFELQMLAFISFLFNFLGLKEIQSYALVTFLHICACVNHQNFLDFSVIWQICILI